jgi:DNA-binding NarL/FixJ family response regulator
VGLPGLNGIETARIVRRDHPGIPVLMLSMYDDVQTVERALRAGAAGYVLKGASVADLVQAIRAVDRGETYLSAGLSQRVGRGAGGADDDEIDPLSPREREVLQLVAEGFTARQIAEQLGLSPKTVENHRSNIMDRLGVRTIAGLVRYAIRTGIVR